MKTMVYTHHAAEELQALQAVQQAMQLQPGRHHVVELLQHHKGPFGPDCQRDICLVIR